MKTKSEQGRIGRARGKKFELDVRHDMEDKGWFVCKYTNTIKDDKIIAAPSKYNPFTKSSSQGSGFPDFVAWRIEINRWSVIGVESKLRKYLSPEEKSMCDHYLKNKVFDQILIGYKDKGGHIDYYEYKAE